MFRASRSRSSIPGFKSGKRVYRLAQISAVWLVAILAATWMIVQYSNAAGRAGAIPLTWPAGSSISRVEGRPNLILFAHPNCPCTRATLGELDVLMARSRGKLAAQVWFIRPRGVSGGWSRTDLREMAAAIPGVTVHQDDGLAEARRFQAETSGQVVVYDRDGQLRFQGGITLSRGHSGDNPGRGAVETLLETPRAKSFHTPVFGCPLFEEHCGEGAIACSR